MATKKIAAEKSLVWSLKPEGQVAVGEFHKDLYASVLKLGKKLNHNNTSGCVEASFALEGLVMDALGPSKQAATKREKLACAVVDLLPYLADDTALCICLQALQRLAVPETVPALEEILGLSSIEDAPFVYALNGLRVINTLAAAQALEKLAKAEKSKPKKTALLLAALENAYVSKTEAVALALQMVQKAKDPDPQLCRMLAKIGVAVALPLYLKFVGSSKVSERALGHQMMGVYFASQNVSLEQKKKDAMAYLKVEPGVPALEAIMAVYGECAESHEVLCSAIRSGNTILRAAAARYFVNGFAGTRNTEDLVAYALSLKSVPGALVQFLPALGQRGDVAAWNVLSSFVRHEDALVRKAALEGLRALNPMAADAVAKSAALQ